MKMPPSEISPSAAAPALIVPSRRPLRLLTSAGSDSSGGAGIQADLKAFAALGCYGMSAVTALTAQNTLGVTGIHSVPPYFLGAQIDAVASDVGVDAVKIGMLSSDAIVHEVARALERNALSPVVLDPVMVSASGARLIEPDAMQALVELLFARADIITPNLEEAALLLGREVRGAADMPEAAQALLNLGARAVLLKGGNLAGAEVYDLLARPGKPSIMVRAPRVPTTHLHGAGCTLSAALAAYMAQRLPLEDAVRAACAFTHRAIVRGASWRVGGGVSPLDAGSAPCATLSLPLDAD